MAARQHCCTLGNVVASRYQGQFYCVEFSQSSFARMGVPNFLNMFVGGFEHLICPCLDVPNPVLLEYALNPLQP